MVTAHKYTVATATERIPRNYHVVLCIFMARGSAHEVYGLYESMVHMSFDANLIN